MPVALPTIAPASTRPQLFCICLEYSQSKEMWLDSLRSTAAKPQFFRQLCIAEFQGDLALLDAPPASLFRVLV